MACEILNGARSWQSKPCGLVGVATSLLWPVEGGIEVERFDPKPLPFDGTFQSELRSFCSNFRRGERRAHNENGVAIPSIKGLAMRISNVAPQSLACRGINCALRLVYRCSNDAVTRGLL